MLIISIIVFIALFIAIIFASDFIFKISGLTRNWQHIALLVGFSQYITSVNLTLWRLENKPINFAVYEFLQAIINMAFTIVLVVILKNGAIGRLEAISLAFVSFGFVSLFILRSRKYLRFTFNKKLATSVFLFGLPLIPHGLSGWARSSIDRFVIMDKIGAQDVGIYSTAFQLAMALSFLTMAFNRAYSPFIYNKLSNDSNFDKIKLIRITYLYFIIVILVAFIVWGLEFLWVKHFLDSRYLDSIILLPWLLFGFAFQGMYYMVVPYYYYRQKTTWVALITTSITLIHVALIYILVPKFGTLMAARIFMISNFTLFIMTWVFSSKLIQMPWKKALYFK